MAGGGIDIENITYMNHTFVSVKLHNPYNYAKAIRYDKVKESHNACIYHSYILIILTLYTAIENKIFLGVSRVLSQSNRF